MRPIESLDELSPGQDMTFGTLVMTEAEILDFARRWDPQPFHVDPERAKATIFGGLIASGLHTQAAVFGHILRTGVMERVSIGGTEQVVRWPAPVRPGDEIAVAARILEVIPSRSKPDRGVAKIRYTGTRVADGALVIEIVGTHFLKR